MGVKKYPVDKLRNVALISHGGAGKTTLAEAMLHVAGVIDRQGKVDEGNTTMDFEPEEVRRKISISAAVASLEWLGHKINLVDTPGYFDFAGEVKAALRIVEGGLLLVDAVAGAEVGTELVARYAAQQKLPLFVVISKMDRENANFAKAVASLEPILGRRAVPLHVPIGAEAAFKGVVDVVRGKAFIGSGKDAKEADAPADLAAQVSECKDKLAELAAENDEELTLKFLEGEPLTDEDIVRGLRAGVAAGAVVPVLCTSGLKSTGVSAILDTLARFVPSPTDTGAVKGTDPKTDAEATRDPSESAPFSALVFKTTADPFVGKLTYMRVYSGVLKSDTSVYNANKSKAERIGQLFYPRGKAQEPTPEVGPGDIAVLAKLQVTGTNDTICTEAAPILLPPVEFPAPIFSVAVVPRAKGDEEKIGSGLARLCEEDITFHSMRHPVTHEQIISGLGDMHLDVMCERLKRKFGVETTSAVPTVPYKETIRGKAKSEYKHKKQSGGRGQYGHVVIEVEPIFEGDQDFEFVDKIFAGTVPLQYRPAVEKGVREMMGEGVIAGYPITKVRCTLLDGSSHDVDSSEMAFKIATHQAFKKGFTDAKPVLLEPIMAVEVRVPDGHTGDIIGDLNKKRGRILGMEPAESGTQLVKALVPLSELARYAIDLRSITQGRGSFTMTFDHDEEVPAMVAAPIIAAHQKTAQAE